MASFASSATTGGARKHAWTNYGLKWITATEQLQNSLRVTTGRQKHLQADL